MLPQLFPPQPEAEASLFCLLSVVYRGLPLPYSFPLNKQAADAPMKPQHPTCTGSSFQSLVAGSPLLATLWVGNALPAPSPTDWVWQSDGEVWHLHISILCLSNISASLPRTCAINLPYRLMSKCFEWSLRSLRENTRCPPVCLSAHNCWSAGQRQNQWCVPALKPTDVSTRLLHSRIRIGFNRDMLKERFLIQVWPLVFSLRELSLYS